MEPRELDDFGVPELLNPHRVDWTDEENRRGAAYMAAVTAPLTSEEHAALDSARLRRRRDLGFIDGEGDHLLVCHEAGDD